MSEVTMKDVAKEAFVSVATVSRVINNQNVNPELKERVLQAIEKLHYYPNSVARSLKMSNTFTIGLLVSNISNPYFASLARIIEDSINMQGYSLIMCSTNNKKERELMYMKLLLEKKVAGIIINTTGTNDNYICAVSHKLPMVSCNRSISGPFMGDMVNSDNANDIFKLTDYLIGMGHTKIAVIMGQKHLINTTERMRGFARAMKKLGIEVNATYPYVYYGDYNLQESGAQGVAFLMKQTPLPSAIIAMSDDLLVGAARYLKNQNIAVPGDVSLCGYGEIPNNDLFAIDYCRVIPPTETMGYRLSELIIDRINAQNTLPIREVSFPAILHYGNSVTIKQDSTCTT